MKVLVTGGAGFIGSHVVDALIARGHDVLVIDDLSSGKMEQVNSMARLYQMDITNQLMAEFFEKEKPEAVFHLAAQISTKKSVELPDFDAWVNGMGSVRLLELARQNNVKKFIFSSTGGAIYGDGVELPAHEDVTCTPITPYGINKLYIDNYLAIYGEHYGLDWVSLRYANVYGPRQDSMGEAGVVAIFANQILKGEQPSIFGDGSITRDYVHVSDVVAANIAALDIDTRGLEQKRRVMNIGTGIETSTKQIFDLLVAKSNKQIEPLFADARAGDMLRSSLSSERAHELLSWKPSLSLEEGISQTFDWFAGQNAPLDNA